MQMFYVFFFFFFQAEDGIRDFHVTGVQTCALPISGRWYDSCPGIFGRPDDPAAQESAEIPAEIAPRPDEPVIVKGKPSAFFGTQLQSMLAWERGRGDGCRCARDPLRAFREELIDFSMFP